MAFTFTLRKEKQKRKNLFRKTAQNFLSMCSVSHYNSKMAQDIEKCYITQNSQLLISNNFRLGEKKKNVIQCIFKALFAKKPNCAIRAEAKPVGRSTKILQQKLRIVIGNNFCLKKKFRTEAKPVG